MARNLQASLGALPLRRASMSSRWIFAVACVCLALVPPRAHAEAHQSASVAMRREPRSIDTMGHQSGDVLVQVDARASEVDSLPAAQSTLIHRHEVQPQGHVIAEVASRRKHGGADGTHEELVRASLALLRLSHQKTRSHRSNLQVPTVPLVSGSPVKIKNTRKATYLAACTSCDGVGVTNSSEMSEGSCPGLLAENSGCMFVVDACVSGTFEIIKVGAAMGNVIESGDLVMLKSLPSKDGDADFYAFAGTCGASSGSACADTASMVRLYKGNASNPSTLRPMPAEVMWTISKLEGEGDVLLGEFVSFNKASVTADSPAAGTNLAVCAGNSSETAFQTCGARSNVYTRQIDEAVAEESRNLAVWQVEAEFNKTCVDPADAAVVNTHTGKGHENVLGGAGGADEGGTVGEGGDDDEDIEPDGDDDEDDDAEGELMQIDD